MKRSIKLSIVAIAATLATTIVSATEEAPKQALLGNYQLIYSKAPATVDSFTDMFKDGVFYGRLRSNTFMYNWEKESAAQENHIISGLGGSAVYQSASYNGFDFGAGLYYSHGYFTIADNNVALLKSGTDVFSRYDYINTGSQNMAVLGQAYLNYTTIPKTGVKVGRQLVESFYTKSNDTKMIPNTFDGLSVQTKAIPDSALQVAYLTDEKLRSHTDNHSLFVYDNSDSANKSIWNGNDDSGMHQGLTYLRLKAAGVSTDAPLIVGDFNNKSVENLSLDASFYNVPSLLSEGMAEANYNVKMGSFSVTPGARYIKQFDDGAGAIGGAAITGKLAGKTGVSGGYKNADSLDSQMVAARVVGTYSIYKLNLGYSQVLDEADLVTPWRAFPTDGYTRSMARTNWIANTKSYRAEIMINDNKKGVYKDVLMQISALHTDADETKGQFDENYYYAGFTQNLPMMPELQWRFRLGYQDTKKVDADTVDTRFELNYLF
ncbi:MAG: OprD family outer membrane porin [Sulfurimonas sp.]|jgi:hypothetical protein